MAPGPSEHQRWKNTKTTGAEASPSHSEAYPSVTRYELQQQQATATATAATRTTAATATKSNFFCQSNCQLLGRSVVARRLKPRFLTNIRGTREILPLRRLDKMVSVQSSPNIMNKCQKHHTLCIIMFTYQYLPIIVIIIDWLEQSYFNDIQWGITICPELSTGHCEYFTLPEKGSCFGALQVRWGPRCWGMVLPDSPLRLSLHYWLFV